MILIETGQQGGGEGLVAMLRRIPGGFLQPVVIAVGTAMGDVPGHVFHKGTQAVFLVYDHLHVNGGGVSKQAVPPGFILLPRMDIRVIPESHRLDPFGTEGIDTAQGAGGAAGVHQDRGHGRDFLSGRMFSIV